MGCTVSPEQRDASRKNREVEQQLKKDGSKSMLEVKLLLLGTGESGKSTILKQMRIIHNNGYTREEHEGFRIIIYENIFMFLDTLATTASRLSVTLPDDLLPAVESIKRFVTEACFTSVPEHMWVAARQLWQSPIINGLVGEAERFNINPSIMGLVDDMERISSPDYVPSDNDVLRSRVKTTGITEVIFDHKGIRYRMFDVGGQRSERKKWVHCFENVTGMIFCAPLSEYDQRLEEDENTNRMKESLKLFDSTCNNRWFSQSSIILFLNKADLFQKKIEQVPLSICFPEYIGSNTYEEAREYIRKQYESLNRDKAGREIYTHYTCATDTNQISFVFNSVSDIIMKENLRGYGLY